MVANSLGDMLINIKNAGSAGKESIVVPHSDFRAAVVELLEKEGYVKSHAKKGKKINKYIEVGILYTDGSPRINGVAQMSRPSKRIYRGVRDIRPVKYGHGIMVLSTPKGILTDVQAKKERVGGEALFKIW